ncbi:MAG: GNAT family N-acetyltransferase [Sphingobacteriaceae bacterium]|nr:GNAT family N-acetyltransferase [Cytophagaceae bacterium]
MTPANPRLPLISPIQFQNAHHTRPAADWIRAVYPLYLQDLTRYEPRLYTLDARGQWQPDYLYWWLDERNGLPLVVECQGRRAGFVLLNTTPLYRNLRAELKFSEFFIANEFRRNGLGSAVVARLAEIYGGVWEVEAIGANLPAVRFWQGFIEKRGSLLEQTESEAHFNWVFEIISTPSLRA